MTPHEQYQILDSKLASLIGPIKFSADINLKLERITHLLALLGDPHCQFPAIHVGGTSGKGSTATTIADMLTAAGYKTGLHTSPHLQLLNERHQIDRIVAPTSVLVPLLDEMWDAIEQVGRDLRFGKPSYFEVQFALSCLYFARSKVDVAVVEVGLGGRLDATNVLPAQVAVLTNVGLDHTAILGDTIEEIITDKAGIIKAGQTVITGVSQPSARQIIVDKCAAVDATLQVIDPADNRKVAMAAVHAFAGQKEISVPPIRIAGRMEVMQTAPTVILDGAHNPDKMRYAAQQLPTADDVILVLAMKAGKDVAETIQYALPRAKQVIVTEFQLQGLWEAVPAETLAQTVRQLSAAMPVTIQTNPFDALNYSLTTAQADDVIWVTGSLYLVGNVRQYWYPNARLIDAAEQRLHGSLSPFP